ncbi:TPR repeat-containing thioredoxin TTL1-like isoform X1 [Hibiscus syriacus]|uniref:TPR repeat-containing thioredoxin TTL1-like isoform X1 n=1 Tax=Hibiscus syriacus TaxID=106335 RepID=UPI0019226DDD|nr:TPR repeat-containing thioredoxin TTL1-like isoform X1 [Hibiscus syriacus]
MSHPCGKTVSELGRDFDKLADQLRDSLSYDDNKPDFRELDLGSPVSPLRTGQQGLTIMTTTATTTSSSFSKSVSGRNSSNATARRSESGRNNHSVELSGSSETSPTDSTGNIKPGQTRSKSNYAATYPLICSGQSAVNSPPVNVLPTGNICPSGKIIKTGMAVNRSSRTDVLGSGSGNYDHGSIMRGGGVVTGPVTASKGGAFEPSNTIGNRGNSSDLMRKAMGNSEPEDVKRVANKMYKRGQFLEALSLYDKAIALSPTNAANRSNRAAALTALGRVGEAVKECEEAVRLNPNYGTAHQRLASLLLRVGHVENARKHLCFLGQPQDPTELQKFQAVERHLSKCTDAWKIRDWRSALREADAAIAAGADFSPQLFMCRVEALLKLHQLDDAESSLSVVPKLEQCINSSQIKFFGMLAEAYLFFVQAQMEMALGRFDSAITAAEKAGEVDARNVEVSILLSNVRLVARA